MDSLCGLFEIAELTEVMRQGGEKKFINLLSHVRIADHDDYDVSILESRFVIPTEFHTKGVLPIFVENAPENITMSIC